MTKEIPVAKNAAKSNETSGGLVVGSKVKAYLKSKGMKSSGEIVEALNSVVAGVLDKAGDRAKANNRSTVRAQDL
ncbi:MAG: hypothetical protein HY291_00870 [Planctomycetes bacterium]|nr:hypothetical protein [Planctomycetota bacterium]